MSTTTATNTNTNTNNSEDIRADAVVVGAGVVGIWAARTLNAKGLRTVVVDEGSIGKGQSSRNLGLLRCQLREPPELDLAMRGAQLWREASGAGGTSSPLRWDGHLSVTDDDGIVEEWRAWLEVARSRDLPVQMLDAAATAGMLPTGAQRFRAGLFTPLDGVADPAAAMRLAGDTARRDGVEILEHNAAIQVTSAGGAVTGVRCARRSVVAPIVVVAAGLATVDLIRSLGINLPIAPARATLATTAPVDVRIGHSVWELGGVGIRQSDDGRLTCGLGGFVDVDVRADELRHPIRWAGALATNRRTTRVRVGRPLFDDLTTLARGRRPTVHRSHTAAANAKHTARAVETAARVLGLRTPPPIEHSWAGIIDATPDGRPILDTPAQPIGLLYATGMSGVGFILGPAIGELLAEIATGHTPATNLQQFSATRFSQRA